MKTASSMVLLLLLFSGCSNGPTDGADGMGVDFVWDTNHPGRSPEIHLNSVPEGTTRLDIRFYDATNEWEHGGGSIPYDGSETIPPGVLKGFKGLSSVWGVPKIRLTVRAFNAKGRQIGKGTVIQKPPKP